MSISKLKINNFLLYVIFFLSFLGFYAIILAAVNAGMSGYTRLISIPIRLLIGATLVGLVIINWKKVRLLKETKFFLLFVSIYVSRIIIDFIIDEKYSLSTSEVLFYFLSFSILPFICISVFSIKKENLEPIINSLFFSGIIFAVFSFVFYRDFIGQTGRLTSSRVGEDVVSPLILSYCSTLIMGVLGFYLLYNKTNKIKKIIGFSAIGLSFIPFFLGASRGSIIALLLPFILMVFSRMSFNNLIKSGIIMVIFVTGVYFLDESFGSGLIRRFLGISQAIKENSSSASRLVIWKISLNQFYDHPFLGDKLKVDYPVAYPHNLFIEVLQTMGVVGFIPFFYLITKTIRICLEILRCHREYSWIAVLFLQAFSQHMFSGAIYTAAWLWTSMALLISIGTSLKKGL